MTTFSQVTAASTDPFAAVPCPRLRASVGDIVFVPARVKTVGTDNRSIRLCIDTGIACIRVNDSPSGSPPTGFVPPELVYHANNSLPSAMLERVAMASPLDSISADFQTMGHTKAQSDIMAMATPWVRSLCFTDPQRIQLSAAAIMSASSASMRLSLGHPTKQAYLQANGKQKDVAALMADFGRTAELDRELWENELPPSKWPAGMIASGLVPEESASNWPF